MLFSLTHADEGFQVVPSHSRHPNSSQDRWQGVRGLGVIDSSKHSKQVLQELIKTMQVKEAVHHRFEASSRLITCIGVTQGLEGLNLDETTWKLVEQSPARVFNTVFKLDICRSLQNGDLPANDQAPVFTPVIGLDKQKMGLNFPPMTGQCPWPVIGAIFIKFRNSCLVILGLLLIY